MSVVGQKDTFVITCCEILGIEISAGTSLDPATELFSLAKIPFE